MEEVTEQPDGLERPNVEPLRSNASLDDGVTRRQLGIAAAGIFVCVPFAGAASVPSIGHRFLNESGQPDPNGDLVVMANGIVAPRVYLDLEVAYGTKGYGIMYNCRLDNDGKVVPGDFTVDGLRSFVVVCPKPQELAGSGNS